MDIDYLLLLQNFREATNNILSPFLLWLSDFAIGFWPIAIACMVYWAFDRKEGKRILFGFSFGILVNGILKLAFRITRPWLRDDRVLPYGNSMTTATGYSFPSGHSTVAVSLLGGLAWWQRNRNRLISVILIIVQILILFSRNYLGVHTPQDVLVGSIATILVMIIVHAIENWTDRDIRRDWIVMAVGIVVCALLIVWYNSITIQEVYDATGALVVDPLKMKADSYEGIGAMLAYVICRVFERRYFHFDTELSKKDRFIIGIFALIPMYLWDKYFSATVISYNRVLGKLALRSVMIVYTMIIVPFVMSKIKLPAWMREDAEAVKA